MSDFRVRAVTNEQGLITRPYIENLSFSGYNNYEGVLAVLKKKKPVLSKPEKLGRLIGTHMDFLAQYLARDGVPLSQMVTIETGEGYELIRYGAYKYLARKTKIFKIPVAKV